MGKHFAQQMQNGDHESLRKEPEIIVQAHINGKSHNAKLKHLISQMLEQLDDTSREDLLDTPRRIMEAYQEFYTFKDIPLVSVLKEGFVNVSPDGGMVVQSDIPFRALCPHHFFPVMGTAAIGYIARRRIVGLSKLTRLVQAAGTTRPDTQEAITNNIANALVEGLDPIGVIVVTKAIHSCMSARGINAPGVATSVSAVRGVFRDVPAARQEFFALIATR